MSHRVLSEMSWVGARSGPYRGLDSFRRLVVVVVVVVVGVVVVVVVVVLDYWKTVPRK